VSGFPAPLQEALDQLDAIARAWQADADRFRHSDPGLSMRCAARAGSTMAASTIVTLALQQVAVFPLPEPECPAGGDHVWEEHEEAGTGRMGWACGECHAPMHPRIELPAADPVDDSGHSDNPDDDEHTVWVVHQPERVCEHCGEPVEHVESSGFTGWRHVAHRFIYCAGDRRPTTPDTTTLRAEPEMPTIRCEGSGAVSPGWCQMCAIPVAKGEVVPEHVRIDVLAMIR
jgi:hypothetical protein